MTSIGWPSSRVTIAFLTSDCEPRLAAETLGLALADQRVDALHLDVEQLLDGRLDLRLGRVARDLEHDLVVLGGNVAFSVIDRGDDDVVMAARSIMLLHLKRASSASTRSLGQHQLVAAQDVVDVDALDRQHVDVRDVAGRERETVVRPRRRR